MTVCHICNKGNLVTKTSSKGPEIYCDGCRRIIVSSTFGFQFTASEAANQIESCVLNSEPGWKGPGKNAQCHTYEEGNPNDEAEAKEKAIASAYAFNHRKGASKVVNALSFFEGQLPGVDGVSGNKSVKNNPNTPFQPAPAPLGPVGEVTTDKGSQIGDLTSGNPLNTASKKIAELVHELSMESMGPAKCTEHDSYECGCNHNLNSLQSLKEKKDPIMYDNTEIFTEAKTAAADTRWFNGSSESILVRLDRLQDILDRTRVAASNPNASFNDLERYANIITELGAEKESLEKLASEYVDFDTEEYINSLPGGTIAREYRISSAGTSDLGDDDGSLLYRTAATIENEFEDADWINFVTAGAELWIEDQSPRLLNSQLDTREAAVYYVESKTLPLLDTVKRASIIDNFVDNVEICRRAKNDSEVFRNVKSARATKLAATFVQDAVEDSFGEGLNWL